MSINSSPPDYELADTLPVTTAEQVRATSGPLRTTILGLLHERAGTVTELATAVGRPKSTVAHHVKVLTDARVLRAGPGGEGAAPRGRGPRGRGRGTVGARRRVAALPRPPAARGRRPGGARPPRRM